MRIADLEEYISRIKSEQFLGERFVLYVLFTISSSPIWVNLHICVVWGISMPKLFTFDPAEFPFRCRLLDCHFGAKIHEDLKEHTIEKHPFVTKELDTEAKMRF